jgi:hypothetical protein
MTTSHLSVLTGKEPSTKTFRIVDNKVQKGAVKPSYLVNYQTHIVRDIHDLYSVIVTTSKNHYEFIIRGKADRPSGFGVRRLIKNSTRSDGVFTDVGSYWVCIDFDECSVPSDIDRLSVEAIEWLIHHFLPAEFHQVTYVYQWSASAGLEFEGHPVKYGTNVHLFFYLDRLLDQLDFKAWLGDCESVDCAVFGAVQPIFVNTNAIKDDRIEDRLAPDQKIGLIEKELVFITTPDINQLESEKQKYYRQVTSIDGESSDRILQILYDVGCVTHQSPNTLSLKSPNETTQGGYYVRLDDPRWVRHGGKGCRRVDQWLETEWNYNFELPLVEDDTFSLIDEIKNINSKSDSKSEQQTIEKVDSDGASYVEAYTRDKRLILTEKAYKQWIGMDVGVRLLLYAFEGFGKSRIVNTLVKDLKTVILACKTNNQVEEQAEKFTKQGFKVQALLSRHYQLTKLGYSDCIVEEAKQHPWDTSTINQLATLRNLQLRGLTNEEANDILKSTGTEKICYSDHDVIVMTHSRLGLMGFLQGSQDNNNEYEWFGYIPSDVILVWDDVNRDDFAWLSPFDNRYAGATVHDQLLSRKTIHKRNSLNNIYSREYFVKPDCLRLGYGISNRQIFSTTELLTTHLIERHIGQDKLFVPRLMPEMKMKAGDITVYKTKFTSRQRDGLLLPILTRTKKEGYDFYIIGDSISNINHTNNKGQNSFDDKDIVVEVSQMNLEALQLWLDELGWSDDNIHVLKVLDAMDRFHQAIGRNSGYRWSDKEDHEKKSVVVLMDGYVYEPLIRFSRYFIDKTEDLDRLPDHYKKRDRASLASCIAWYIQNVDSYITAAHIPNGDKKGFERDCLSIQLNYEYKYVERMKIALRELIAQNTSNQTKRVKNKTVNPKTAEVVAAVLVKLDTKLAA